MNLITTMEHVYAIAIGDMKKAGAFVQSKLLPALTKAEASAGTIEAITGLVSPQLENIERVGAAVLGVVIKAIEDAGAAAGAGGVSVSLDAALIADVKAIIPAIKAAINPAVAASVPAKAA